MKTKLKFVGTLGLLLMMTGCQPDAKTEARLKNIELRQEKMKEELLAMSDLTKELSQVTRDALASNQAAMTEIRSNAFSMAGLMFDMQTDMEAVRATNEILLGARSRALATTLARPVYQTQAQMQMQTRDGVPMGVYNQIAADASRRYPTDYDMQAFVIKEQIAAYRKLHP